jgi:mRNA-degrading endonuclease YafQ of YafQ-DinJ toxin-antitoxin module
MREFDYSNQFKKDVKKAKKQPPPKRDMEELKNVMSILAEDKPLRPKNMITHLEAHGIAIESVISNQTSF